MGLIESKYKSSRNSKNSDLKKSKTLSNGALSAHTCLSHSAKLQGNEASKTLNGCLVGAEVEPNKPKKVKKNKVFHSKKLESTKVTNNSGHKSNHGRTKEDADQRDKWTTIPRSAHSTIERLIKSLDYQIVEFHVTMDDKSSILAEKTSVLKYKTPHFRAKASVIVPPLEKGDQAVVGWIQVVNSMIFVNRYGDHGLSSWEFPELTTGRQMMISDSDGHRYPWYGSKKEVAVLKGPTSSPSMLTVIMNDNFSPQVTWFVPAPNHRKTCKDPKLTRVFRKQSFTACLAVMKVAHSGTLNADIHQSPFNPYLSRTSPYNGLSILRAIKWELKVDIYIDPTKQVGERSTIPNGYLSTNQYLTINDSDILSGILDLSALHPPNANKSQTLIWRPFSHRMLHPDNTPPPSHKPLPDNTPPPSHNQHPPSQASYSVDDIISNFKLVNHYHPRADSKSPSSPSSFSSSSSASSSASSPPILLTSSASPSNPISPSLSSISNLSSPVHQSSASAIKSNSSASAIHQSSALAIKSKSSASPPLAKAAPDKWKAKLKSAFSTDVLAIFENITPPTSLPAAETRRAISQTNLLTSTTPLTTLSTTPSTTTIHNSSSTNINTYINHPFKKAAENTSRKCRVVTNERNKLHQSKLAPPATDAFRPLLQETVIVQPAYTKVEMHTYLRMTSPLTPLLHKCVANDVEHC